MKCRLNWRVVTEVELKAIERFGEKELVKILLKGGAERREKRVDGKDAVVLSGE